MPVIARAARDVVAVAVAGVGGMVNLRAKSVRTSDAASLCASTDDDDDDGDVDDDDDARRHRCDAHRARAARHRVSARRAPDEDIVITIHVSIGEATHEAAGNARVVVG